MFLWLLVEIPDAYLCEALPDPFFHSVAVSLVFETPDHGAVVQLSQC